MFKLNGNGKSKKKKKIKPKLLSSSLKPNQIKKQLIARVKLHHKKKQMEIDQEKEKKQQKELEDFQNDFNDSLQFLEKIAKENTKKREKRREKNKTQKKNIIEKQQEKQTQPNISKSKLENKDLHTLRSIDRPAPPYSILKNSNNKTKPLFSQYNKTLKKSNTNNVEIPKINIENNNMTQLDSTFTERKKKLNDLKNKIKTENEIKSNNKKRVRKRRQKTRRLIRKVTLGKNTKNGTIGVLIKNKKTRKNIKNEHKSLQKKALSGVKNYLRQHNLIKIGTNAPEMI